MASAVAPHTAVTTASVSSACEHCGLGAPSGSPYCCYGCELAAEITAQARNDQGQLHNTLIFSLLLSMVVMMMSLFLYAGDIYDVGPEAGLQWMRTGYRVASAVLATPVVLLIGIPLARSAARLLRRGRVGMDLLIVTASLAAYILSMHAVITQTGSVYFDSATAALLLATFGRYLEATARTHASQILAPSLQHTGAVVQVVSGTDLIELGAAEVIPGSEIFVPLEAVVPLDVEVTRAPVEVNLSVVTGESVAIQKHPGEMIPAGAVIMGGELWGIAVRRARDSTLEHLAGLAKSLRERPAALMRIAERFATVLIPATLLISGLAFGYWLTHASLAKAVVVALATVLAACPCTYGIAAPLVLWLSLRKGLSHQALIRDPRTLEELARVRTVAFDKTGTLTQPHATVLKIAEGTSQQEVLAMVAALEAGTTHPTGLALKRLAEHTVGAEFTERRVIPGYGVCARDGRGRHVELTSAPEPSDASVVLLREGHVLARFGIREELFDKALPTIAALQHAGLHTAIISGDALQRAQPIADKLGVEVFAAQSPEQKVVQLGKMPSPVAMVGDGLNDAPALAARRPSFCVHSGTTLARGHAM
ncbi:MAG: HAD-IC family P-type ATPase [Myxococcota bacterium]